MINHLSLTEGDNVVIAMIVDMISPNYHHLQIWRESGAMTPDRYMIVTESFGSSLNPNTFEMNYSGNAILLVEDEKALKEFHDWWVKYSERFDGLEHETYLPTPNGKYVAGYMHQHTVPSGSVLQLPPQASFKDEWAFIVANCPGKVYWTITHWIFEDQNDAVMFKLKRDTA